MILQNALKISKMLFGDITFTFLVIIYLPFLCLYFKSRLQVKNVARLPGYDKSNKNVQVFLVAS